MDSRLPQKSKVCIFDLDGTLTESANQITDEMVEVLTSLQNLGIQLVIIGSGTYNKITWQLKDKSIVELFDRIYAECGSICYQGDNLLYSKNFQDVLTSAEKTTLNNIIKRALFEISQMPILYSGHQIDVRLGLVYISPPGMQASEEERQYFLTHNLNDILRTNLISSLQSVKGSEKFQIVRGGNVGIAVYPQGFDKSQIMKDFDLSQQEIHFFGDRVTPDGNDYPLYSYPGIIPHGVESYRETISKLRKLFLSGE